MFGTTGISTAVSAVVECHIASIWNIARRRAVLLTRWIHQRNRSTTGVTVLIVLATWIPHRIPRQPPAQVCVVVPPPVELQSRLRVAFAAGVEVGVSQDAGLCRGGTEIV